MKDLLGIAKSLLKYSQENPAEIAPLNKQEPAKKVQETKIIKKEAKTLSKAEYIKKQVTETEYAPVFQKSLEKDVIDFRSGNKLDPSAVKRRARIQSGSPQTGGVKNQGLGSKQHADIVASDKRAAAAKKRKKVVNKEELGKMGFANPPKQPKVSGHQTVPTGKPKQGLPSIPPPKAPKGGQGGAPAAPTMMKDSDHVTKEKANWKKDSYNKPHRSLPKRDRRKEKKQYSKEELDIAKQDAMGEYKPQFQKNQKRKYRPGPFRPEQKGVRQGYEGRSTIGGSIRESNEDKKRSYDNKEFARHDARAALKESRAMPKPNLPKSEIPANKIIKPKG